MVRAFMRRIASQTIYWFFAVQALIVIFGMVVRICDPEEKQVAYWDLAQERAHRQPGDFWHAMRYHFLTYYICGLDVLLIVVGIPVTAILAKRMFHDVVTHGW